MNIENYISSGIIEQYVLGLCDAEEIAEVENLRLQNNMVGKAIYNAEIALEKQYMDNITLPSENTDNTILQKLYELKIPTIVGNTQKAKIPSIKFLKWASAAAVLLLAISTFINYALYKQNKEQALAIQKSKLINTLPQNDYNVLKNPAITPIAMMGVGIHAICRCTMFWDKSTGKVYVMVHHLMPISSDKEYQLWATVNGKQIYVGTIDESIRNQFVALSGMPDGASEFAVALEKKGDKKFSADSDIFLKGKI